MVTIKLTVKTNNGEQHYTYAVSPNTTVLELLELTRKEHDSSLMYRHSCHHGSCGTCTCIINGKERLACTTTIESLGTTSQDDATSGNSHSSPAGTSATTSKEQAITVAPLRGYETKGGIAVLPEKTFREVHSDWTYLRAARSPSKEPSGDGPENNTSQASPKVPERFENCIECGACVSVCPAINGFKGPFYCAALYRERENRPESGRDLLVLADSDEGVWGCRRAIQCSLVCPQGVAPARKIAELRRETEGK